MHKRRLKRQPTRDDLASALHIIRDQSQIIGLLAQMITRQQRAPLTSDAIKKPIALKKSKVNECGSSGRFVN